MAVFFWSLPTYGFLKKKRINEESIYKLMIDKFLIMWVTNIGMINAFPGRLNMKAENLMF